jgi:hypothetical protein
MSTVLIHLRHLQIVSTSSHDHNCVRALRYSSGGGVSKPKSIVHPLPRWASSYTDESCETDSQ